MSLQPNQEGHKLLSPSSDLSFEEMESTQRKPISRRSSSSDISFHLPSNSSARSFLNLKKLSTRQLRTVIGIGIGIAAACMVYLFLAPSRRHQTTSPSLPKTPDQASKVYHPTSSQDRYESPAKWVKPEGFKIVGFVFYGRPRYVNILDCYLKKNLVSNGGFLDEVVFMINTHYEDDAEWLNPLIEGEPLYSKKETVSKGGHFDNIWNKHATDDNTMYIKIDDDVVFVHEDTIPRMVNTLMNHPEAHDVAANIINSPLAHWLNYHTGAVLPYVPENLPANQTAPEVTSWRASELPKYTGNLTDEWEFPEKPEGGFITGTPGAPPSKYHRWLPLEHNSANLMKTPVAAGQSYDPWGKGWRQWTMAAQQHYSLLEHMEKGDFGRYWAGDSEGVWNMQYTRYNLNFLAIWGSSVKMMGVGADDEDALTVTIPKALKRPCIVDTHAIIGHFAFGTQPEMEFTDVLDRYRLYANERVCAADNQKKKLDKKWLEPKPNW